MSSFIDSPLFPLVAPQRRFAVAAHESINQRYLSLPYSVHLDITAEIAWEAQVRDVNVFQAIYGHDLLEDVKHITPGILAKEGFTSLAVATIEAVTDPEGANRRERKERFFPRFCADLARLGPPPLLVKLCDRAGNTSVTVMDMYIKEYPNFRSKLQGYHRELPSVRLLWDRLDRSHNFSPNFQSLA